MEDGAGGRRRDSTLLRHGFSSIVYISARLQA